MNKKQAGFTMLELVLVIAIFSLLTAIILPKFVDLHRDARIAKLKAARAAVKAAVAQVHLDYTTRNGIADTVNCPAGGGAASNTANGTLCMKGGLISLANGYPAGATPLAAAQPGIIGAAGLLASVFTPSLAQLNLEGYGAVVNKATGVTTISVFGGSGTSGSDGAQTNATCSFTYTAASANAAPAVSAMNTIGC